MVAIADTKKYVLRDTAWEGLKTEAVAYCVARLNGSFYDDDLMAEAAEAYARAEKKTRK